MLWPLLHLPPKNLTVRFQKRAFSSIDATLRLWPTSGLS